MIMKRFFKIPVFLTAAVLFLSALSSCVEVAPTKEHLSKDIDTDYEFTYGIREFIEYDAKNPGGINLLDHFDFFDTFKMKFYVENGKFAYVEIDNGDLPFDEFGFTLPQGKTPCYYDEVAVPHEIRLSTGETIVQFNTGELVLPFVLDSKKISYKMTFQTLDSTREGYEK